ncbi:MAG: beta-lactamase family protein [Clostridia bacterium]|nr:beta-lactamase family protein [Clostridia bacterium]
MRRSLLCLLALCFCVSFLSCTVTAAPADPRVATAQEQLRSSLGVDTPGAIVLIAQGGELTVSESYGYANIEQRTLVTLDTAFELGDLSSVFVTLGALALAEQGDLDLGASIADYLPAALYDRLALTYPVSVRQLLCGTAGFEGRTLENVFEKDSHRFASLEEALLAEVPRQVTPPDTVIVSSPFAITLAALVIEAVSGVSYTEYITQNVLTPLGMHDTVLEPTASTPFDRPASGHVAVGEGRFSVAAREGRSYSGLYPATGAISTGEDLASLLSYLTANGSALTQQLCSVGLLSHGALTFTCKGEAYVARGSTLYFGASLCLAPAKGLGALVLTNAAPSALLELPEALCGASVGVAVSGEGELPELKVFEGVYSAATMEQHSLLGKLHTMKNAAELTENDDGTLSFLGKRLRQVQPGVFVDAEGDGTLAVVQILRNAEGEVTALITAEGETYLPLPFYYAKLPATVLRVLLVGISVYFLLVGLYELLRLLTGARRGDLRSALAYGLTALLALSVLLQLLVAWSVGTAALSAFFDAMAVVTLFCGFGALVGHIFAFVTSLLDRRLHHRVAYNAMLLVVYVLLICFFGLSVF